MLAIIVLLLILLICLSPYLVRVTQRVFFLVRLRRICRLKRYKIRTANIFCLLFRNMSRTYDLTVDTGKTIYCVKLWSEFYRNTNIIFNGSHAVLRRKKASEIFGNNGKMNHSVYEKLLGRLVILPPENKYGRRESHVFIFFGRDISFYYHDGNCIERLSIGDKLYGMTLVSEKIFLCEIGK